MGRQRGRGGFPRGFEHGAHQRARRRRTADPDRRRTDLAQNSGSAAGVVRVRVADCECAESTSVAPAQLWRHQVIADHVIIIDVKRDEGSGLRLNGCFC